MQLNLSPISDIEMLQDWAIAELGNHRFDFYKSIPKTLVAKLTAQDFDEISFDEWQGMINMIAQCRSPLLAGLLQLRTSWYRKSLPYGELANLSIIDWPDFVELAPSKILGDLATAIDHGMRPRGDFNLGDRVQKLSANFKLSKMAGSPIFVTKGPDYPLALVEGFTRCCALVVKHRLQPMPGEFPIIVGINRNLDRWFLDNNRGLPRLYQHPDTETPTP
jgi:hypothetical protein